MVSAKSIFKSVLSMWFSLMLIAGGGAYTAYYLYRRKFGGEFSPVADDWSAFGSYMGGVLGPLISLLTLAVVIRTVYLQRELLDTQRQEALALKVAAAQDTSVKAIEMLISMQEKDYDRNLESAFKYREEHKVVLLGGPHVDANLKEEKENKLQALYDCRDRARLGVALLSQLALMIATESFVDVQDVRDRMKRDVVVVYKKLDDAFPSTANKKTPTS